MERRENRDDDVLRPAGIRRSDYTKLKQEWFDKADRLARLPFPIAGHEVPGMDHYIDYVQHGVAICWDWRALGQHIELADIVCEIIGYRPAYTSHLQGELLREGSGDTDNPQCQCGSTNISVHQLFMRDNDGEPRETMPRKHHCVDCGTWW